jgi:geranylgeranyl diphosphate synthase type II
MLLDYKNKIDAELKSITEQLPKLSIYDPIKYIVSLGGKRFRSSLLLFITNIFSNNPSKGIREAAAIELFHNFTLIHDDIMDQAPLRRGKLAVHKKWDTNTAILSGDLLYALVNKILASSKVQSPKIHSLFQKTAMEVCEGQSLDMAFEDQNNVTQNEYIEMIKLKTAVLVACSLKIGAIIGGASEQDAQLLYDFGIDLGISFQIHDDILDVYPTEEVFGKQVGGDILEKKKTILFLELLAKISEDQRNEINQNIDDKLLDDNEKVNYIKSLYNKYNVLASANQIRDIYFMKALESLSKLSVDQSYKKQLKGFATNLMNRKY